MKIKLSRSAERDLSDLRAYIAADNPRAADEVAERLAKAIVLLRSNPLIGRPGSTGTVREWSVPGLPYVIPYKVRPGVLYVLRIFHTSRNRPKEWR